MGLQEAHSYGVVGSAQRWGCSKHMEEIGCPVAEVNHGTEEPLGRTA